MSTRTCPGCGAEYLASVAVCPDCRLALVDTPGDPPEGDGLADDHEGGGVAYDLADWDVDQRARLEEGLREAGIPWEWDGDELVVDEHDEGTVEAMVEAIDFPDALAPEEDDGAGDPEVLADLFVAADRLAGNPGHGAALGAVLDWDAAAQGAPAPYGVDERTWRQILDRTSVLARAIAADADPEELQAEARQLRSSLRPLV